MQQRMNDKIAKVIQKRNSQSNVQIRQKTEELSHGLTHNDNSLANITCKIGDNVYAAKHASLIQRAGLFHPMNERQKVQSLLSLQQQYGNRFVQRVIAQHAIQTKLQIGQPGDIYEQEADRVAEQVMHMPDSQVQRQPEEEEELLQTKSLAGQITPFVQKQVEGGAISGLTEEDIEKEQTGGPATIESSTEEELPPVQAKSVNDETVSMLRTLPPKSSGRPIPDAKRKTMERGFGHDFSAVRLHSDAAADHFVSSVNAYAAAYDTNIYSRSDIAMESNPWLLAHELAHVVQQGQAPRQGHAPTQLASINRSSQYSPGLEREADAAADSIMAGRSTVVSPAVMASDSPLPQFYSARICGRPSTQFPDFPETYISQIDVGLTSPDHNVTLTWAGPNASSCETGPFHSSPGAGECDLNCDNESTSQTSGSMCTPKGTRQVEGYACALGSDSRATNATYFHRGRGIAFHYFPSVPNYPASHGCVRLGLHAAQLIYDNSRRDVTNVTVGGTWTRGSVCY
jgi:hypothetical protein